MNCINLYYAFVQSLNDCKDYYLKNYNTIPEFKAGMAEGTVTVTEVGDMKREIAYHGEAVVTAARLEKMCNSLEKNVLVNQNIISLIQLGEDYDYELMGEFLLKGKIQKEKVYCINRCC